MKFTEYLRLNEAAASKSRTDKWTLDQIKNAKYSSSFMNDKDELYIKGELYVKIGKDEWQHFPSQARALGATYSNKKIYDMMNESEDSKSSLRI